VRRALALDGDGLLRVDENPAVVVDLHYKDRYRFIGWQA
jgi:hypothetical protein